MGTLPQAIVAAIEKRSGPAGMRKYKTRKAQSTEVWKHALAVVTCTATDGASNHGKKCGTHCWRVSNGLCALGQRAIVSFQTDAPLPRATGGE